MNQAWITCLLHVKSRTNRDSKDRECEQGWFSRENEGNFFERVGERNKDLEVESNSCPLQAIEIDIITLKGYKAFLSVDES